MSTKVHPKRSKESQQALDELHAKQAQAKPGDKPRNDGPASGPKPARRQPK